MVADPRKFVRHPFDNGTLVFRSVLRANPLGDAFL